MGKIHSIDVEFIEAERQIGPMPLVVGGVVQHFTAGGSGRALARWVAGKSVWKGKKVKAAKYFAQFTTCRDGHIIQQADINEICYHAAGLNRGLWPNVDEHAEINDFVVGIENSNYGWLLKKYNRFFIPKKQKDGTWEAGKPYPDKYPAPVRAVGHDGVERWWEPFTEELIDANSMLLEAIVDWVAEEQGVVLTAKEVRGHSDISPDRKWDPGPLFPMNLINDRVFGSHVHPNQVIETEDQDDELEEMLMRREYDPEQQICMDIPESYE